MWIWACGAWISSPASRVLPSWTLSRTPDPASPAPSAAPEALGDRTTGAGASPRLSTSPRPGWDRCASYLGREVCCVREARGPGEVLILQGEAVLRADGAPRAKQSPATVRLHDFEGASWRPAAGLVPWETRSGPTWRGSSDEKATWEIGRRREKRYHGSNCYEKERGLVFLIAQGGAGLDETLAIA